ncbi:MAG: o-succinylbenzoate synthase [Paracoccaceae bacterium]|nr:o-succinylbenzoate synthase [Paracoccaceae bacterium]MDG2257616.1 o-succinylbenzoate synthase [Paracoccaceae bacterium]
MRLTALDFYHVEMPYHVPWVTSFGSSSSTESVLVRMETDAGFGWAETAPSKAAQYSSEFTLGTYRLLTDVIGPALIGQDLPSSTVLQDLMAGVKGNKFAKSVIDIAWWDTHARTLSTPLWQMIGGVTPRVPVGADLTISPSIDTTLREVGEALDAGFLRIKLKYGLTSSPELVRRIRDAYPEATIHVDCNACFTLDDLPMFKELDDCGLKMIEQPLAFDDIVDHAMLQKELQTPLCLDESITSLERARKAVELNACGWVNIKVGRVGGITPSMQIHDFLQEKNIPCWIGGMLESALGQGASLALATLPNVKYPSDVFPTTRFFASDLARPEIELSGPSTITAPEIPGLGFEPDPDALARMTLCHKRLSV